MPSLPASDLRSRPSSSAQVVVLSGPVLSGKTNELVRHYRATLANSSPANLDRAIWLAPNGRTAAAVRQLLVRAGLTACLNPGVLTFEDLTRQILAAANFRLKPIDMILERELLRRVVEAAIAGGKLEFFADAASRPGFIDLVAEHIAELKRRAIRPDAYAHTASRRTSPQQQTELAQLYADYESLLAAHSLADRESAHDAARLALAKNACTRFQNPELLVADGFTDFTSTQYEILRLLAQRANQLFVSLAGDAKVSDQGSTRADLFAKTTATLHDLQRHFPRLEVRGFDARPLISPAIDHIAQHMFGHPKHLPAPSPSTRDALAQIEVVEAAGTQDEIVQVARRIKALLTTRTKPSDVLVVFRSLTNAAPRVREAFDRFGIPYYLDAAPPIATAPAIKTLLDLLQLDQEDWRFRRVVSVLTNNTLSALGAEARRAAEWLVRDLQIASGKSTLLSRMQSLAEDPTPPENRSDRLDRRIKAATAALPALQQLASAFHELPQKATPTEWAQSLARLAASLNLSLNSANHDAWNLVQTHFAALERLDTWLNEPPRQLTRAAFITLLRDVVTNASLPRAQNEAGRVRVLSATAARNTSAKHLFLAGMSEQAFPAAEPSGRLATDAEYRRLAQSADRHAVPEVTPVATRAQAEMLLFYELISRAEESLTISFPALDDKAQTLPPSPYVVELERLFADNPNRRIKHSSPQLSPVASRSAEPRRTSEATDRSARGPYCLADWRTQAVARALETDGDRHSLASLFACDETKPLAASIDAGLRIVHARARGESFGPAEGLLTSSNVAVHLAQRFGRQHTWSVSQWETYAVCPFRFFMEHVLGLEPLGDLVLETDFARRGSRLHDVLAAFHQQWLTLRKETFSSSDEEGAAFLTHLREVARQRTSAAGRIGVDAALLELDRRQILKWANRHFDNQARYDAACHKLGVAMTPAHFEYRFGPKARGNSAADPNSTSSTFILDIDGEPIQITGQIDRIDVGTVGGKTVFNVIDYKSGRRASLKREQLETGQQLQLPIYVEAAQVLVFNNDATPLQAGYWGMGSGFDAKGALACSQRDDAPTWNDTHNTVHRIIRQFIDSIRHGHFPVDSRDDKCTSTCDYRMTCRVSQVRSLNKTQWPEVELNP